MLMRGDGGVFRLSRTIMIVGRAQKSCFQAALSFRMHSRGISSTAMASVPPVYIVSAVRTPLGMFMGYVP